MTHLVGVDVGGTFTDVLLMPLDGGPAVLAKVPTTTDPAEGVVRGILEAVERAGVDPGAVRAVLHGTTIATNTVLEGKGARVGLLVTRGFRYVLEIARSWTPGPISGWIVWDKPQRSSTFGTFVRCVVVRPRAVRSRRPSTPTRFAPPSRIWSGAASRR